MTTTQKIPLRSDVPWYSLSVELDGRTYGLELRWNDVSNAWFISLADASGAPIISSLKVVVGWPISKRYADPRLPPGILAAIDTTGRDLPPGRSDLGSRVELHYIPA